MDGMQQAMDEGYGIGRVRRSVRYLGGMYEERASTKVGLRKRLARADEDFITYKHTFKSKALTFKWKRAALKALTQSALTAAGVTRAWTDADLAKLESKQVQLSRQMLGTKAYTFGGSRGHPVATNNVVVRKK